jgi:hypothetical protein
VVERWIPGANVRKDLFGFIDIVAVDQEAETWGIQVTTAHNVNARIEKIRTECLDAAVWLLCAGWSLAVVGVEPDGSFKVVDVHLEELFDEIA